MSGDYKIKGGGLKLKGNKQSLFKADKGKAKKSKANKEKEVDQDMIDHGGWRKVKNDFDLKGGTQIAIESASGNRTYLMALDNGTFTVGPPHDKGDPPSPEEIFALVKTPDEQKISFKTGYGKYVGVDSDGKLIATAEAIGSRERFQPVFEEGKTALQAIHNPLFLSFESDREGHVFVASRTAKENEMINIRTDAEEVAPVDYLPDVDKKPAKECETAYVKMYQHSKVDLKGRHISIDVNDKRGVKRAQQDGDLHEYLLDRRAKMKSDKYC
ncbi:hypothetical protein WR25_18658 [Diploscapter pachys]|uniref:Uncharacterized protein n=1 Tax=Diploscapter pachys TaxID=2018661 RepID=A0A2A2LK67_9BILA|nr:hypothetical protein WR25_18658 [Diploscapter pachys]